ncbi:MAG: exodeoxyribonuclease VII large subunit, partial [Candidatus Omnitrophica bacterium]|nr:exodeoxyribonuclease VII large subunit [Candidatus Omnitrophota bacterium]
MYFSLKDTSGLLSAVLFKNINQGLKFKPQNGMQVICFGKISLYEKRGQYQLNVFKIEPKGVGALQLAFEQLKARLAKEGLFDQSRKRPLPFLPQRIGVVTSAKGAAIRDILNILDRRFANLEIIVNPVRVQGKQASAEIAQAIDEFNRFGQVDVLIVGRGGGSLEDLWAFNEEEVARAIYRSQIPVISAVGHEIDYTIADFVADFRAPTPSAAAEQVIIRKQELLDRIDNFYSRAKMVMLNKTELLEQRLQRYVFRDPSELIQQYQQRIDELISVLQMQLRHLGEIHQERFNVLIGKLKALSPLNILARGYSITFKLPEEEVITKAQLLKVGTKIKTTLSEGAFISKVEEIK